MIWVIRDIKATVTVEWNKAAHTEEFQGEPFDLLQEMADFINQECDTNLVVVEFSEDKETEWNSPEKS